MNNIIAGYIIGETYKFKHSITGQTFEGVFTDKFTISLPPRFVGKDKQGRKCHLLLDTVTMVNSVWENVGESNE